jgi:hypothetical protein
MKIMLWGTYLYSSKQKRGEILDKNMRKNHLSLSAKKIAS